MSRMRLALRSRLALLTLGLLSLAGPAAAAPRGTLTIGIPTDVTTLDPTMAPEVNSLNVAAAVLEPLLRLDARERLQPLLAESWEVVDAVTYVFRLRRNVSFHNGEPLTGRAVEASWRRSQEKHRANREAFAGVARMDHLDDHTIRVVTRTPDPLFLRRMATAEAAIFPLRYTAERGDHGVAQRPVGTGPFRLAEWVRGERIVFRASPAYHQPDVPRVQTLVWRVVPETASRVAALRTGQLDIALRIPPHQALPLEREPGVRLSSALSTRTFYVAFNTVTTGRGTPVMDRRVRLALNLAVDVEAIVKGLFLGQAERVNSLIGNVQLGHDPTLPPLPYDPARARVLLAEAGHGDGFRTGMACPSGAYPYDREACQAIAGYLHKLGVEVDLQVMEPNRFWDLQAKRQLPPLFLDGVGDRFQDPDTQLEGILSPDSPWTAFEKAEFTELIRDAGRSVDPAHRKQIYARLARAMQADPPAIFLWQAKNFEGVRTRVSGYATRPSEAMSHVAYDVSVVD